MPSGGLWRRLILGLLLGVAVAFGVAVLGDGPKVIASLRGFDWRLLPLILLLTFGNYCLRWLKWQYYLGLLSIGPVRKWDSVLLFFGGLGMTMTPGKAGEWVKSVLLRQMYGTPLSHSAPIILAERLSDGLAMLLLASVGAVAFSLGRELLAGVLVVGALAVGLIQSRELTMRLLDRAERFSLIGRHAGRIRTFYLSAHQLLRRRSLAVAVGLGLVSWFGECVAFFLVLSGLGIQPSALLLLQATFILAFATLVGSLSMLPGGLGTAEGSIALLLVATVGVGTDLAAASTLLIRLCTLWFGVSIGIVAMGILLRRADRDSHGEELRETS